MYTTPCSCRAATSTASRAWRSCVKSGSPRHALCRKSLPPGPDKLFDLGWRIYAKIMAVVGPDVNADWKTISLSSGQQRGMDQSRALLLEAAAQGHMEAQAVCGDIYSFGMGVAKDEHLAFVHNEKAAEQGKTSAISELGALYYNGEHYPQDYEQAVSYFKKGSALGHANGSNNTAICYEYGRGVPQSYKEALRFYTLAAQQGYGSETIVTASIERMQEAIRDDETQALSKSKRNKKLKPNQRCSCGSGKKYKKCCGRPGL